jgi:two-component system, sensor histidine kinase and response regulator
VLVVDDNPTHAQILADIVTGWGAQAQTACSGGEAIARLIRTAEDGAAIQLVLMDVQMPGLDGFEATRAIRALPVVGSVPIILETSTGVRGDAVRCREVGANGYLSKPVRRTTLFDAIMMVLDPQTQASRRLVTRHLAREAGGARARVLVAEDNPVNQKVTRQLLERAGHQVSIANDGEDLFRILKEDRGFDLILMDIQMPRIDGLEATRRLRADPQLRQIPIVAMTAHAMQGDRERFTEAGMDDYLCKPVRSADLCDTVERWARADSGSLPPSSARVRPPSHQSPLVFDPQEALARVEGDRLLLAEVLSMLKADAPRMIQAISAAIASQDLQGARREAHTLKGALSNLGAQPMVEALRTLESAIVSSDTTAVQRAHKQVVDGWDRLSTALAEAFTG